MIVSVVPPQRSSIDGLEEEKRCGINPSPRVGDAVPRSPVRPATPCQSQSYSEQVPPVADGILAIFDPSGPIWDKIGEVAEKIGSRYSDADRVSIRDKPRP